MAPLTAAQTQRRNAKRRAYARLAKLYPTRYGELRDDARARGVALGSRVEVARRELASEYPEIAQALVAEESFGL